MRCCRILQIVMSVRIVYSHAQDVTILRLDIGNK